MSCCSIVNSFQQKIQKKRTTPPMRSTSLIHTALEA